MKKPALICLIGLASAVSGMALVYGFSHKSSATHKMKSNANAGFVVVELFTSEGCSSCPPADEAVATLLSKNKSNVYILSFHVDYWNRLGWTDPFSLALFSARQRTYAQAFSLESIYTPQVVVNGSLEFTGSDATKLNAAVATGLTKEEPSDLKISMSKAGNAVTVRYAFSKPHAVLLNIALVQPEAGTVVKRGENRGKTLHHVNIVRAFHTVAVKENGHLTLDIPPGLSGIPLQVIAYTQFKESYAISGADQKNIVQ